MSIVMRLAQILVHELACPRNENLIKIVVAQDKLISKSKPGRDPVAELANCALNSIVNVSASMFQYTT